MMPRLRSLRREAGTAALETMFVMTFLFTLIFGFVHICLFAVTKSVTNYAAFTASRAALVGGGRRQQELAARQVMSEVQWWDGGLGANMLRVFIQTGQRGPRLIGGRRRSGVRVTYFLPFGYPVFRGGLGVVRAVGFAPTAATQNVPDEGDNR